MGDRRPARTYTDPLDLVWLRAALSLGLHVERRDDVYAAYDGRGTLTLGAPETLDADDCLAQMILHEICHWVVMGFDASYHVDWGFEPTDHVDWREYPTIRLQCALARAHGLGQVLAPTTNARAYYDRLADPSSPLDDSAAEARIVERTALALQDVLGEPWHHPLQAALAATAAICAAVEPFTEDDDLFAAYGNQSEQS